MAKLDKETAAALKKTIEEHVAEVKTGELTNAMTYERLSQIAFEEGKKTGDALDGLHRLGAALFEGGRLGSCTSPDQTRGIMIEYFKGIDANVKCERPSGYVYSVSAQSLSKAYTFVKCGANARLPDDYVSKAVQAAQNAKAYDGGKLTLSIYERVVKLNRAHAKPEQDRAMSAEEMDALVSTGSPNAQGAENDGEDKDKGKKNSLADMVHDLRKRIEKMHKAFPRQDVADLSAAAIKIESAALKEAADEAAANKAKAENAAKEQASEPPIIPQVMVGNTEQPNVLQ